MHFPVKFTTFANVNCMRFNGERRVGKAEKLKGISTWLGTFIPLMQFHEEVSVFLVHQFSIDNSRKKWGHCFVHKLSLNSVTYFLFSLSCCCLFSKAVLHNNVTPKKKSLQ